MSDTHAAITDIQCITQESNLDSATMCADDLASLSRLVDRIRDTRAAFQAACNSYDMSVLDLWVRGASTDDVLLFQLMLDFNTKYLLQKKAISASEKNKRPKGHP